MPCVKYLFILLVFYGCRKKTSLPAEPEPVNTAQEKGLPPGSHGINGYLYASYRLTAIGTSSNTTMLTAYATFNDPEKNLAATYNHLTETEKRIGCCTIDRGNVSVGAVFFNNDKLDQYLQDKELSYSINKPYMANIGNAQWAMSGNQSFTGIDLKVNRGFPMIQNTQSTFSLSLSEGGIIDVSSFASNYDSMAVRIGNYFFASEYTIFKSFSSSPVLTFKSSDLKNLFGGENAYITFMAFNYSHQTVNDKVHLFELGYKLDKMISLKP